ncbi:uncharacterized protein UBRO2_06031 [Ustilago bromivora]|uniref:Uncharacterized protein n=1 Tax=Ustilago bromivora TaxID=307758 RepID=A0A8H8TU97_9BASI|nr:uncharacterized protein UBRO2_06031 [Ustilago bromivora]
MERPTASGYDSDCGSSIGPLLKRSMLERRTGNGAAMRDVKPEKYIWTLLLTQKLIEDDE